MALNLTGISNENEFYTHHYLSAILENDLKELFAKWTAQEEQSVVGDKPATWRSPYAKLGGLSKLYFVLRNNLEKKSQPADIQKAQHEFFTALLDALGYQCSITLKPLDEGAVPILGEIKKKSGAPDLWILETIRSFLYLIYGNSLLIGARSPNSFTFDSTPVREAVWFQPTPAP